MDNETIRNTERYGDSNEVNYDLIAKDKQELIDNYESLLAMSRGATHNPQDIPKQKIKDDINRYAESDRGKQKDFDDLVYWLKQEWGI